MGRIPSELTFAAVAKGRVSSLLVHKPFKVESAL